MGKIVKVAVREYVETARTKAFLIGVLMTPALIAVIVYVTGRYAGKPSGPQPAKHVVVADLSNDLSSEIKEAFRDYNASRSQRPIRLRELRPGGDANESYIKAQKQSVRDGGLDVLIVLDANVVEGAGKIHIYTRSARAGDVETLSALENLLNRAVANRRLKARGISPQLVAELRRRARVEHVSLAQGSQERRVDQGGRIIAMMVPFLFMFLMFMGVFGMGQHLLTSITEEKSSRVIEVLLSALSPFELMAGKIVGLGGIGLTVIGLWGVMAAAAARWRGVDITMAGEIAPYFAVYYVLGFLLFCSLLAGVGSVCTTPKEAQSLLLPVNLLAVLPMASWYHLVRNPNGLLAVVLSYIPSMTPMVMILRVGADGGVHPLEIAASIVLLAASVVGAMWAAAKVFRVGILMYGKRPGLGEMLRWVRQK